MNRLLKKYPAIPVMAGFLSVIIIGTVLLKLPISNRIEPISWIDAMFTATSAVCVTGLIVVDTGTWFTVFGQIVILALIQIGGLGVMTITVVFFQWMGRQITVKQRFLLQDQFSAAPRKDIFRLVSSIILFTLAAETAGVIILYARWQSTMPDSKALYHSVFHSISAFCNAGFSLNADSLMAFKSDVWVVFTICLLIVLGGIGFPVLYDLAVTFRNRKLRSKITIQTRIVLITTTILIFGGALMFGFLERHSVDIASTWPDRVLTALFQSITCRTAGFNTVDIGSLNSPTLMILIFLMFFGASPGSCGGGVKTTTLAILTGFIVSRFHHSKNVTLFKKTIPRDTVNRSMVLIIIAIFLICAVLFMILTGGISGQTVSPKRQEVFLSVLFESVSAFGTVGLSMGLTPDLNTWGKSWIIFMMIIGRIGVLTFAYLIVGLGVGKNIEYAEENVMIG